MNQETFFRFIGHASVLCTHQQKSILFDPWFGRAVNHETFSGYPRFVLPTEEERKNIIAIHVSHIHYDHLCMEDLVVFPKDIPILIGQFRSRDLNNKIRSAGFTNVIEIPSQGFQIGPFKIYCQMRSPENQGLDSSCVLNVGGQNYFLNNDCIHSPVRLKLLRHEFGQFQGAFLGYAVANPLTWCSDYSQCLDLKTQLPTHELAKFNQGQGWEYVSTVANILEPKWAVPYASSYRFLNEDLAHLNAYFGVDEEIYDVNLGQTKPIVLKHGEIIGSNDFEKVQRRDTKSRPEVPLESVLPKLFNQNFDDKDLPHLIDRCGSFFQNIFSRVSRNWHEPMAIEIRLLGNSRIESIQMHIQSGSASLVPKDESLVDVILEAPASAFEKVLLGKCDLHSFYYMFCVRVIWKRLKYGQMNFLSWQ